MDVKATVLACFTGARELPGNSEEERLSCLYLDQGIVDSMGIIDLVTTIESQLGVRFSPADMQSVEFRTAAGLIAIARRLVAERRHAA